MCASQPPGNDDGSNKIVPKKHMMRKGKNWTTWIEVDGKPVPGSEKIHANVQEAREWIKRPMLN